jgi:hypothetical protein
MWIDIFKGGSQTDCQGRIADGDALIDKALATFDPAYHEPPVTIGHPADNAPAFGWVEKLQAVQRGGVRILQAKFKQMASEFVDMVRQGRYKKRSASFYPDGRLRHVGFLGAMPPAVKGLSDVPASFRDPESDFNEYLFQEQQQQQQQETIMELKEFFEAMKFWKEATTPAPDSGPKKQGAATPASFSEADIEAAKKQAAAEAAEAEREKLTQEFAEKEALAKRAARSEAIRAEVDSQVTSGKIAPAWVKSGLVDFMQGLDGESEFQFAETRQSQLDWFRKFLSDLPKLVDFGEIAMRDKDVAGMDPGSKLGGLVNKKRAENRDMTYSEALNAVQTEHPDLAREYLDTLR